jgi:hypothetical protein
MNIRICVIDCGGSRYSALAPRAGHAQSACRNVGEDVIRISSCGSSDRKFAAKHLIEDIEQILRQGGQYVENFLLTQGSPVYRKLQKRPAIEHRNGGFGLRADLDVCQMAYFEQNLAD